MGDPSYVLLPPAPPRSEGVQQGAVSCSIKQPLTLWVNTNLDMQITFRATQRIRLDLLISVRTATSTSHQTLMYTFTVVFLTHSKAQKDEESSLMFYLSAARMYF